MSTENPNGSNWIDKYNRPDVIATNSHHHKKTNWVARPPQR